MRRCFGMCLAALLLVGCGESATAPATSIVGRFEMRTLGGQELPYSLSSVPSFKIVLVSSRLAFASDGTCADSSSYRQEQAGVASYPSKVSACTYEVLAQSDTAVTARVAWVDGGGFTATVRGRDLQGVLPPGRAATWRRVESRP